MRRLLLMIVLLLSFVLTYAQTSTKKYNSLHKRYEYYDSRGNMTGYEKWNDLHKRWEYFENKSSQRNNQPYVSGYNYDLMLQALSIKQAQYEKALREEQNRINAEARMVYERKIQTINTYNSFIQYPENVPNGWHNVTVMDTEDSGVGFCANRKVYVYNNEVTKYLIDDAIERKVTSSDKMVGGYGRIKADNGYGKNVELAVFFLENIRNPKKIASEPPSKGSVSFWSDHKKAFKKSYVDIYIDGKYMGRLNDYFTKKELKGKKDPGYCDRTGTLKIWYKPGTYSLKAVARNGLSWTGTVTFKSGSCTLFGLNKR